MAINMNAESDKLELHPSIDEPTILHRSCMNPVVDCEAQSLDNNRGIEGGKARQMGEPGVLGISVFAVTNTMIGLFLLEVGGVSHNNLLVGMLWYTAGAGSAITAVFELILGNTFGYVVFGSFAGYYCAFASTMTPSLGIADAYSNKEELCQALGIFFCCWGILFFFFLLASLKTTLIFIWIFFFVDAVAWLIAASYFQDGAGQQSRALLLQKTAGGFLVVCSLAGWYLLMIQLCAAVHLDLKFPIGDLSKKSEGA